MQNGKVLSYNKTFQHIGLRHDEDIDPTAIRIGKQRVARNKTPKVSALKEAILSHRNHSKPDICSPELEFQELEVNTAEIRAEVLTPQEQERDCLCEKILKELARLQAKGKDQPPEKQYKYKKFVVGVREVNRALRRGEIKGIMVARNVEDDVEEVSCILNTLRSDCLGKEIPFISALTKRRIGKCLDKSMKQTLVGILNLEGVHQHWKELIY